MNFIALILTFLWLNSPALAVDRILFNSDGTYGVKYKQQVEDIKSGDRLHFSDGVILTVDEVLGQGQSTKVFSIIEKPNIVIRIARSKQNTLHLKAYSQGANFLESNKIPHTRIIATQKLEYIIVEKIDEPFIQLSNFIFYNNQNEKNKFEKIILDNFNISLFEMRIQLETFLTQVGFYNYVSDFHESNIVYDFNNKTWKYMDWSNDFENYDFKSNLNNEKIGFEYLMSRFGIYQNQKFSVGDQIHLKWFEHLINRSLTKIIKNREVFNANIRCEKVFLSR